MAKYVFLVHGLGGVADLTWGKFPEFLRNDPLIDYQILEYGYQSPHPVKQFFLAGPSLLNIANGLLTDLQTLCNLDEDDIILVGHSMGGLVIKRVLLRLKAKKINHKIFKVCFFDVPHNGAGLAKIGKFIAFRNRHIKSLCSNTTELDDINDQWLDANLNKSMDILSIIDASESVVSSMSSKSIFRDHPVETINNVDHERIVKPNSEDDVEVKILKNFIISKKKINKYKNRASKSFEKWIKFDEHRQHNMEYFEDKEREEAYISLCDALKSNTPMVRLTGLSGLGKTRLLIEYIKRNKIDKDSLLIYDGTKKDDSVESLRSAISDKAEGLVIIDNCSIDLHNIIQRIVSNNNSLLKIVTVFFYNEKVENTIEIKLQKLDSKKVKEFIKTRLPNLDIKYVEKLDKLIEGFPLLANMLIKKLEEDGVLETKFSETELVEKLVNGDSKLTTNQLKLIRIFSLFDVFQFTRASNEASNEHAEFINMIAGTEQNEFESTVRYFEDKELLNLAGKFARVVPKPLALNLAMDWWNKSLFDSQSDFISRLPPSLLESFCRQITYLDSSINVQDFVENFCSDSCPFGQAELLLSSKGSRLFRALVEVNPKVTSKLIYRVFNQLSDEKIKEIKGDSRRNFVWALEMLVFHESCFKESSWCLFKLAQLENESYGNNATGQFSQLFRWQLSGTEADFHQRILVLKKILSLNVETADLVVIEVIKIAISTRGAVRSIGAEFQGTKSEIKEWKPKVWQEIYDYWQMLFDILVTLAKKEEMIDAIKNTIGDNIRGLVNYERIEMLNNAILDITLLSDKYWTSASQSIIHALKYDEKGLNDNQISSLHKWKTLFAPSDEILEEKLKLIVLNPPDEYNIKDHNYTDIAAEKAKSFAKEIKNIDSALIPNLELIFKNSVQKQSWCFAKEIVTTSDNIENLLASILIHLRLLKKVNTKFLCGFLVGLNIKDSKKWEKVIDIFISDKKLHQYLPDVITTGHFKPVHLDKFIELIKTGKLSSSTASTFIYGGATAHIKETFIAQFCINLSKIDSISKWIAFDIINMYIDGRSNYDVNILNPVLKNLSLLVSFKKDEKLRFLDSYIWLNTVEKLLALEGSSYGIALCEYIFEQITTCDIDYSDRWDYLHEAFHKAFEIHSTSIWPILSKKFIAKESIIKYHLSNLLGSGNLGQKKSNSIFTLLDESIIIDWCKSKEKLDLVGRSISMFDQINKKRSVNHLLIELISNYGNQKDFLNTIYLNFHSRSWTGSLIPYLESDKELLIQLKDNNFLFNEWRIDFISMIDRTIKSEIEREAEENILSNF